jgi:integrase
LALGTTTPVCCSPGRDGRPVHPDTFTSRFRKIVESAGLPKINLHDVRHSYASAGRDAKIDWKALSERIGHSDVAFTTRQYVQTDLEVHRQVATALAQLILGGVVPGTESPEVRGNGPDAAA